MVSQEWIDKATTVRQGEELDIAALLGYMQDNLPELDVSEIQVKQFPSGHSNLTYLLRLKGRELVLRRPPFGAKIATAHDMQREYNILSHLVEVYPKVPHPLLYCGDPTVIGTPFYIMQRLEGVILRSAAPQGLQLTASQMRSLSENFIDNLVKIHQLDYRAAGLGDLGHPEGYVRRQIEGWTRRYHNARTDDIPEIIRVADWLSENMPGEVGASMIHNDYKYDNLVLDPGQLSQIVGVLDWEMATIGDPLMDLGTSLGYWVDPDDPPQLQSMAFGLTALPGNLNRRQLAERYAQKSGLELKNLTFYYVYALFKIAVIVQQIYARYKAGFTHDERFATLIFVVQLLGKLAVQAIDKNRIDNLSLS
jgi:aminoglycoside phosphotransferase (APT) family kinase protein